MLCTIEWALHLQGVHYVAEKEHGLVGLGSMTSSKVIYLVTTVATIVPFGFALLASAMLVRRLMVKHAERAKAATVRVSGLTQQ